METPFHNDLNMAKQNKSIRRVIKTEQNNYRPVSIIPIVSKMFDYLINKLTVISLELN